MVTVDLITGFLGSGKTTFLLKYADYLIRRGERIGIMEYDRGAVNADMMLLQPLRGDHCELEMLSAACDEDCLKRRFRTKLISMAMSGYDRVIIEPTGVFDVDDFFDVLHDDPLDRWYEIGSIITVVSAKLEEALFDEADFLLASQMANAGTILLSRTQNCSEEELEGTIRHLETALQNVHCTRKIRPVLQTKPWSELTDVDLEKISQVGYSLYDYEKTIAGTRTRFDSVYLLDESFSKEGFLAAVPMLLDPSICGNVFRIKGFFEEKGQWYQCNITKTDTVVEPIRAGKPALTVIGADLKEDEIRSILRDASKKESVI